MRKFLVKDIADIPGVNLTHENELHTGFFDGEINFGQIVIHRVDQFIRGGTTLGGQRPGIHVSQIGRGTEDRHIRLIIASLAGSNDSIAECLGKFTAQEQVCGGDIITTTPGAEEPVAER